MRFSPCLFAENNYIFVWDLLARNTCISEQYSVAEVPDLHVHKVIGTAGIMDFHVVVVLECIISDALKT